MVESCVRVRLCLPVLMSLRTRLGVVLARAWLVEFTGRKVWVRAFF